MLSLLLSLVGYGSVEAQTEAPVTKMSVNDRLVKARAAKADKKTAKASETLAPQNLKPVAAQANQPSIQPGANQGKTTDRLQKATPADYKSPVDKSQHGPHGEVIYTGARGAKYYINKNGNKTYLSSNL